MRGRWLEFVRIAAVWTVALVFLDLVHSLIVTVRAPDMSIRGWSHVLVNGATSVSSVGFHLPVGVLIGAVSVASRSRKGPSPGAGVIAGAAVLIALFSFVASGFVGPHLEYHARIVMMDRNLAPADAAEFRRTSIPNDWALFRSMTAERSVEAHALENGEEREAAFREVRIAAAMLHQPIVLGLLAGLSLPLGLLVGRIAGGVRGVRERLGRWGMTAGIIVLSYGGWIWAWMLLGPPVEPFVPLLYLATLTVPAAVLATLWWAATMNDGSSEGAPIRAAKSHPTS